jgi:hypothetical protein
MLVRPDSQASEAKHGPGWHIATMSSCFAPLCNDHIRASFASLLNMLRMADHIHVYYVMLVETVNHVLWCYTNG